MFVLKGSSVTHTKGPTGPRAKSASRQNIEDLSAAILEGVSEWKTLEEGRADILSCMDTLPQNEQLRKMRLTVEQIDSLDELVKYAFNLRLKVEGLSVHRVLRGK
jgi:hypothetical protein